MRDMGERRGAFLGDLSDFLPFRIHRLAARLGFEGEVRTSGGVHVKVREWRVMALLAAKGPMSGAEICAHLEMDPATVSRAVRTLAAQELVRLRGNREDGRKIISELTRRGLKAHDEIAPKRQAFVEEIEACLSPAERVALFALLDKLDARCADLSAEKSTLETTRARSSLRSD